MILIIVVRMEKKMTMVSVIVPVYKVERYLDKCVNSILRQTYSDIEIILVDDGSPDRCGIMCDDYSKKDSRIKVIHKRNGGLSDARNVGIKKATGKYLLFVDSDDWIHEKLIERTVQTAEKNRADIVLFDYISVEERTERKRFFTMNFSEDIMLSAEQEPRLISKSCSACNKLFRKDFWQEAGLLFPVGKHYEDLGTIPKAMGIAKSVVYKKEAYYYYLQRTGSIMHGVDFEKNYEDRVEMLDNVLDFYKKRGLFEKFKAELEYLVFENAYFVPSKEIVLSDCTSPYLKKFREYAEQRFPRMYENLYIGELSGKDKILYQLLKFRAYKLMVLLSKCRRLVERVK